jgi:F5/8 type C domain
MKYNEITTSAIKLDNESICNDVVPISSISASHSESGYPALNAIDKGTNTWWASDRKNSWIQIDLGSVKSICSVQTSWYKGTTRAYNFVLATSTDGTTFTNVIDGKSKSTALGAEKNNLNNTKLRYIRITINGNSENNYASISDMKVYGTPDQAKSAKYGINVNILTDSHAYFPGDAINIVGSVHNTAGAPLYNTSVFIVVSNSSHPSYFLNNVSVITDIHGNYGYGSLRIIDSDLSTLPWSNLKELFFPPFKIVEKPYTINATASYNGTTSSAWATVEIRNGFYTTSALMILIGGILFILFLVIVAWPMKLGKDSNWESFKLGHHLKEILIFALISAIALNPIVSLLLLDMEVGKSSPVGLIKKDSITNGTTQTQWVMNIGGSSENGFKSGIQIPTYILVFGIAGGYIRYLYDKYEGRRGLISVPVITSPKEGETVATNRPQIRGTGDAFTSVVLFEGTDPIFTTTVTEEGKWNVTSLEFRPGDHSIRARTVDESNNSSDYSVVRKFTVTQNSIIPPLGSVLYEVNPSQYNIVDPRNSKFFKESIQNIALIFLSPLLAIAIWFVLFQGGTTADYTLAAIGITTGFLIREIVTRMINFASPKVTSTPSNNNSPQ